MSSEKLWVVVRVRGLRGVRSRVKQVLSSLKLGRKHACMLLPQNASTLGMLRLCKDYVTWGEASEKCIELLKRKGRQPYALHPPKGGMGQIKRPFPEGALGNRGAAINELVEKMV